MAVEKVPVSLEQEVVEPGPSRPGRLGPDEDGRPRPVAQKAAFVDIEPAVTHQFLRAELGAGLAALGVEDLDVATVRGPDRRVTKMISEWAYLAREGRRGRAKARAPSWAAPDIPA